MNLPNADVSAVCIPASPPPPLRAQPYTEHCRRLFDIAEHAVIGLSPFNGGFNPHTVQGLVAWGVGHFRRIDVLLPGYEAAHTLVAAGARPLDAVRRLRHALNALRNAATRQLQECGIDRPEQRVHTWTRLQDRAAYLDLRRELERRSRREPWLHQACESAARNAVAGSGGAVASDSAVQYAVQYALAELPFLVDSPSIFGAASSVFVYPRPIPLVHALLERDDALPRHRGQGYVSVHRLP